MLFAFNQFTFATERYDILTGRFLDFKRTGINPAEMKTPISRYASSNEAVLKIAYWHPEKTVFPLGILIQDNDDHICLERKSVMDVENFKGMEVDEIRDRYYLSMDNFIAILSEGGRRLLGAIPSLNGSHILQMSLDQKTGDLTYTTGDYLRRDRKAIVRMSLNAMDRLAANYHISHR